MAQIAQTVLPNIEQLKLRGGDAVALAIDFTSQLFRRWFWTKRSDEPRCEHGQQRRVKAMNNLVRVLVCLFN